MSLKENLQRLEMERRNLLACLDHFKVQKDNYDATFKMYSKKVELLIKQQADGIEKHLKEFLKLQIEKMSLGVIISRKVLFCSTEFCILFEMNNE